VTAMLGANRYGKAGIRMFTITRDGDTDQVSDLTVDVWLEGAFEAAYTRGDNRDVLPTDTLRGTVYALAAQQPPGEPEHFAQRLAARYLAASPAARTAEVAIASDPWARVTAADGPHPHAFSASARRPRRTARVRAGRDGTECYGGIAGLLLAKTRGSAFDGFLVDAYTTLAPTSERVLATSLDAEWRYRGPDADVAACAASVPAVVAEAFAGHDDSRSLQHTLQVMGEAALTACDDLAEIRFSLPNRHHVLVDLAPYGLVNDGTVLVATDRPYGVIEGTVTREEP